MPDQHRKTKMKFFKFVLRYIPVFIFIALGLGLNSAWNSFHKNVLGYATGIDASSVVAQSNSQRAANGVGNLSLNSQLSAAAQAKANDMAAKDYWSHVSPGGTTPAQVIANSGYAYTSAGENLAYGFDTTTDVINAWMNSPDHRANLLNGSFKDVGIGMANAANYQNSGPQTIVVAEYGDPVEAPVPVAAAPQPTPTPKSTTPVPAGTPTSTPTPTSIPVPAAPAATTPTKQTPKPQPAATTSVKIPTAKSVTRIQALLTSKRNQSYLLLSTIILVIIALYLLRSVFNDFRFITSIVPIAIYILPNIRKGREIFDKRLNPAVKYAGFIARNQTAAKWHNYLKQNRTMIVNRLAIDIVLAFVGTIAFLLVQRAGFIH